MKRIICCISIITTLAVALVCFAPIGTALAEQDLATGVKAAYLCDIDGAVEMVAHNADHRYPIASMVKIMTALLTVEALERGEIALDETLCISPEAMGMGGSQMFLNAGDDYPIADLLKGVVVVSANDACVALAERLAGSEGAFVAAMNDRAAQLGMTNTHFANCTGLPHPEGYSCAKDVSKMLAALVRHEVYHRFSQIWLEDYTHPDGRVTTMTNTNKLIRFYDGCDGGKTGFTQEAGFCLAATALKKGMRVVSVVIGAGDSKSRFATSTKLLNYAFANYQFAPFATPDEAVGTIDVKMGKDRSAPVAPAYPLGLVCRIGKTPSCEIVLQKDPCKAPLVAGDQVGVAKLVVEGVEIAQAPLLVLQDVPKATYGDAIEDFLGHYHL